MNSKTNLADVQMDLVRNVDRMRECYMKFACLPDSHGPLVREFSDEQTVLWHLASAMRKALAEIVGDETLGEVIYNEMGDSGESASYLIENYWMHMLHKAAEIKNWRRNVAKYN